MPRSSASVPTQNGSRYLTRLCKHWSHKLTVDYAAEQGRIDFGDGRVCTLAVVSDGLVITVQAEDAEALPRLEQVVADHLIRMADRDELSAPVWTRS